MLKWLDRNTGPALVALGGVQTAIIALGVWWSDTGTILTAMTGLLTVAICYSTLE